MGNLRKIGKNWLEKGENWQETCKILSKNIKNQVKVQKKKKSKTAKHRLKITGKSSKFE